MITELEQLELVGKEEDDVDDEVELSAMDSLLLSTVFPRAFEPCFDVFSTRWYNFLAWQCAVYVSLSTKLKLGFIDGSFPRPAFGSENFQQWRRVDLMVTSWIWNSMSKDIVEAFMFCASSRELWVAIQMRYGRSNGPKVYQLQREISTMSQQDLDLTAYLTKVTKLWNELDCLAPSPRCTCGACTCGINKAIADLASTKLMQFLMGLHES
ncbi:UNVERIFIED_CONTAM: hypothetical protein Sradi_0655900 [Sesamum radiatum]|uniref:Retrotransposon gag domain-containing protein n=1 Tax=Sesamum radiatum TaxID=300843 RepID=A0AAW2VKG9_SESRA